ncbi:MAG: thrombospondin type 3 repeat-containing protein [Verrucomicrobia subdivision 3 bacterium]|nr:thrombospondin type 3 repeat-containing protein [Limisphaerales bacterium]
MPKLLHRAKGVLLCLQAAFFCSYAPAEPADRLGSEYGISGSLPGDQVWPHVSIQPSGGYVVWQDNFVDGDGPGIGARRLDASLSPSVLASFRVNQQTVGAQQHPRVATQPGGSAAIVWHGGVIEYEHIWLRGLNANGTFTTASEIRLNTYTNGPQKSPVITALANGNYAVAWSSLHEDGNLQGVYLRLVSSDGQPATEPVRVNQFTAYNQRTPDIAALSGGGFVVAWASENQGVSAFELNRGTNRVHIYARVYDSAGAALGDEFRVNTANGLAANPSVTGLADGGFAIAWSQRLNRRPDSWDVWARYFDAAGQPRALPFRLNTHTYGDQFGPRLASLGGIQFAVWTSLVQDGYDEGVFGRLLSEGAPVSGEFTNNTTVASKQIHPAVVADGQNRFLVVWSSYQLPAGSGFNLYGQRYSADDQIPQPSAPYVAALSSSRLAVSWPALVGFPVTGYEIYMDGVQPPDPPTALVTTNVWIRAGLAPASTHTFRLAYVMAGGARSALSPAASGITWGDDENLDGLPDDWQSAYWGIIGPFPAPNSDSDGDGASNASEYLAGTDPIDPDSVLKTWMTRSLQGPRLNWNTQPGFIYQVQTSADFGASWSNLGAARFAAGPSDSIAVGAGGRAGFYRITRVR